MRARILAILTAAAVLIGGGAYLAGTANAQGGPAVLCAKTNTRDLKVFDVTCPAGYFPAQIPASAVAGTPAPSPTAPAPSAVPCPSGYSLKAATVAGAPLSETDQAALVKAQADLKAATSDLKAAKDATDAAAAAVTATSNALAVALSGTSQEAITAAQVAVKAAQADLKVRQDVQDKAQAKADAAQAAVNALVAKAPALFGLYGCVKG